MIAILHLSDIHVRTKANTVTRRVNALADALRSEGLPLKACFIAVTGDIAFSGLQSEYTIAGDFLFDLNKRIVADHPAARTEYLLVPGNHDCDFTQSTEIRDLAIANLPKGNALNFNGDIVSTCLSVQDNFFDFTNNITGRPRSDSTRLYETRCYEIDNRTIAFHLYNTAWLSKKHEKPGTLSFPISLASDSHSASEPADVTVALLHHPFNWFDPTNARNLCAYLERTCDVVLTGHEHVPNRYRRTNDAGADVAHVEGAVLQASDPVASTGFNVIWLDIPARRQITAAYSWSDNMYKAPKDSTRVPFARNPLLAQQAFENNQEWADVLDDPGTAFTHPRQGKLRLSDLFVYPDLTRRSVDPVIGKKDRRVDSREVLDFIASKRKIILTGPSDSGKTSLAKRLYMDLKQRVGSVPIFIPGEKLHKLRNEDFLKVFVQAFEKQYTPSQATRYKQLKTSRRLVIVDDFEQARLSRKARADFISAAVRFADSVLIFADDLFMIDKLSHSAEDRNDGLGAFEHCAIREFGYRLRGTLIERWHGIGYETVEQPADFDHQVVATEKFVETLLGKNLLPSLPLMVLMILQTAEASANPGTGSGAYGYLYEVLITCALAKASKSVADLDTKYTYLAHVAYAVYRSKAALGLSKEDVENISEEYFERYRIRFSVTDMLMEFERIDILANIEGCYSFRYNYIYCYFVARYFRDCAPGDPETKEEIRSMVSRLHVEDYANVLVFYLYLTRDVDVIEQVLDVARKVYSNHAPCDFDTDVGFVNTLYVTQEKLRVPSGNPAEHREEERARRDNLPENAEWRSRDARELSYSDDFDDLLKVNFGLKALHVMGQVLRNFPGSLQAEVKADLASESYLLGLRTLKAILKIAEDNVEELRAYFAGFLQENQRVTAVSELAKAADEAVIWATLNCAFGMTKRISNSIGLYELKGTFADVVVRLGGTMAVRMIDASVKLDHFPGLPLGEIEKLEKDTRNNHFTHRILVDLVINHMYLFRVNYKARQKVGKLLDIEGTAVKFIANPSKIVK